MKFGYELIIDLKDCKNVTRETLINYSKELCDLIKMKRYGSPRVVYFGEKELAGWTMVQLITTSSIIAHFTKTEGFINIFSCKNFNKTLALSFTKKYFNAKIDDYKKLTRGK